MEGAKRVGVQDKYLKSVLGLNKDIPGYIVKEEIKRDNLGVKPGNLRENPKCKMVIENLEK